MMIVRFSYNFCRLVSGDYRGFVMIWEMEDIKEELVLLERRLKNIPKDGRWACIFFILKNSSPIID